VNLKYNFGLSYYFLDVKSCFVESPFNTSNNLLTTSNYQGVLQYASNIGFNGLRMPMVTTYPDASYYSTIYNDVMSYGSSLGMVIHGSPLGTGFGAFSGWSNTQYAQWVSDYANGFGIQYVSPFNEAGINAARMETIVGSMSLTAGTQVVGPDAEWVKSTLSLIQGTPSLAGYFDIISTHNDTTSPAAASDWEGLYLACSGKTLWSTEDHSTSWEGLNGFNASEETLGALCVWLGIPALITLSSTPTTLQQQLQTYYISYPSKTESPINPQMMTFSI
jgi:hypothetical protein